MRPSKRCNGLLAEPTLSFDTQAAGLPVRLVSLLKETTT